MLDRIIISLLKSLSQHVEFAQCFSKGGGVYALFTLYGWIIVLVKCFVIYFFCLIYVRARGDSMESKLKHLDLIQGVINRMANNSFLLKGWSVTLISALFALAAKDSNSLFIYLAYFPCVAFWSLDGYFLWQERMSDYWKIWHKIAHWA